MTSSIYLIDNLLFYHIVQSITEKGAKFKKKYLRLRSLGFSNNCKIFAVDLLFMIYLIDFFFLLNNFIHFLGDTSKGELGFAAIPGQEESFKESIERTIRYAKALNCKLYVINDYNFLMIYYNIYIFCY